MKTPLKISMQTKQFNEEVYYVEDSIIKVSGSDIALLKKQALITQRKRIRLCTHKSIDDEIHEMLIVHVRDTYIRPHKHLSKPESFHVIEGRADVIIFDDNGNLIEVIQMGEYASGLPFYYRLPEPLFHTLLIQSDILVFHEITKGPFKRSDTIIAPWAPDDNNEPDYKAFLNTLKKKIKESAFDVTLPA